MGRPGHLLEFGQGGMEAGLHGADGDLLNVGDFAVFQVFEVGQDQRLFQGVRQLLDRRPDPFFALLALEFGQRVRPPPTSRSTRATGSDSPPDPVRMSRLIVG